MLFSSGVCRLCALSVRLIHQRAGFGNTALYQVGLDLQLLVRTQIDYSIKGQIARQGDANAVPAGGEQHRLPRSVKLVDVSGKLIVHKDRSPGGGG